MNRVNFWSRKLYRRTIQLACSYLYVNPDPDVNRSILVAGTARSGTTWLGDMIAAQIPCRILFEPFNPDLVPEYRGFNYFQYMRPGQENTAFFNFARRIFTGEIRNRWIDRQNEQIFPKYRLIKEIRANLSLKWLHEKFPQVPIIFIIRHPCAVALSRMSLGWATDRDISHFLAQPDLVEDYLGDYLDLIGSANTPEEKHAIIWCISNFVPLKQANPGELRIVYYENLCTQPEVELANIFEFIHHRYKPMNLRKFTVPSLTAKTTSAVVSGSDRVTQWKRKLNPTQINNILRVVNLFDLDYLYGDSHLPLNTQE